MKKEYKYIIIIFLAYLAVLYLGYPVKELLNQISFDLRKNHLLTGVFVRSFILLALVRVVKKLKLKKINGLGKTVYPKNFDSLLIPSAFIVIGIITNWHAYVNADIILLLLFVASVFLTGFAEEFLFRGIILPLFIRSFYSKKRSISMSVFLSSSIFGLVHYINLSNTSNDFWGITSQVFFAFTIGVFLSGLFFRTGSIVIASLFHGLINFSFGTGELKPSIAERIIEESSNLIDWNSVIPTAILFLIILGGGINMIRKVPRENILKRLY